MTLSTLNTNFNNFISEQKKEDGSIVLRNNLPRKGGLINYGELLPDLGNKNYNIQTGLENGISKDLWKTILQAQYNVNTEILEKIIQLNWTPSQIEAFRTGNGGLTPQEEYNYRFLNYALENTSNEDYATRNQIRAEIPNKDFNYMAKLLGNRGIDFFQDLTHTWTFGRKENESNENYISRITREIHNGVKTLLAPYLKEFSDAPLFSNLFTHIFKQIKREEEAAMDIHLALCYICPYLSLPHENGNSSKLFDDWYSSYFSPENYYWKYGIMQNDAHLLVRQGAGLSDNQIKFLFYFTKYKNFSVELKRLDNKKFKALDALGLHCGPDVMRNFQQLYSKMADQQLDENKVNQYDVNCSIRGDILQLITLLKFKLSMYFEIDSGIIPKDYMGTEEYINNYSFSAFKAKFGTSFAWDIIDERIKDKGWSTKMPDWSPEICIAVSELCYQIYTIYLPKIVDRELELILEQIQFFQNILLPNVPSEVKPMFEQYISILVDFTHLFGTLFKTVDEKEFISLKVVQWYRRFLSAYNNQGVNSFENIPSNSLLGPSTPPKKPPIIEEPEDFTNEELENLPDTLDLDESTKHWAEQVEMQNTIADLKNVQSANEKTISSLKIDLDEKEILIKNLLQLNEKLKIEKKELTKQIKNSSKIKETILNEKQQIAKELEEIQKSFNNSSISFNKSEKEKKELEQTIQGLKYKLAENEKNTQKLLMENQTLKQQLSNTNESQTIIQELKQQLRLKDQHIKTLQEQKNNSSNSSEFYIMYNNEKCPKENIQELVDGLVGYIKNFSILNPQNNKYYHTQEEVQDFVNKLYGLYKTGTRRVNQLMEEKMRL